MFPIHELPEARVFDTTVRGGERKWRKGLE